MPRHTGRFAFAVLALCWGESAVALEYCVTCEGPAAMYRCVVEGTPEGAGTDASTSLYCISEMASKGRHQSCSVARGAPFPCPGFTAMITAPVTPPMADAPPSVATAPDANPSAARAPATGAPEAAAPQEKPAPSQEAEATPPEAAPAPVPRTVEELAGQTVKSSKEGIEKAGEAIGGTAKKAGEHISSAGSAIGNAASETWNCITSLFSSCGSPKQAPPPEPDAPPAN